MGIGYYPETSPEPKPEPKVFWTGSGKWEDYRLVIFPGNKFELQVCRSGLWSASSHNPIVAYLAHYFYRTCADFRALTQAPSWADDWM